MLNLPKLFLPQRCLGIDVGTSFVKMVEMSRFGHRLRLENYGFLSASVLYEKPFRTFEKNTLLLSSDDVAKAITAVREEAKTKTKQVVFSIPDFSTFFTNFNLPKMTQEEIPQAVRYEARQHIPVPLGEVALDWQVIDNHRLPEQKDALKILLVAVPNEIINQYQKIAELANLDLIALEAEVFSLLRSLIPPVERGVVAMVDIGAQSTTCSVVDNKILKMSHSFDMSGDDLTDTLAKGLNVDFTAAENLKKQYGIKGEIGEGKPDARNIREMLLPLIDIILRETEMIFNNFYQRERKEIQKVIMAGSTALLPGLKDYFQEILKKEIEVGNPFANIFFPPILEKKLELMGPGLAIAVGLARRGLEY